MRKGTTLTLRLSTKRTSRRRPRSTREEYRLMKRIKSRPRSRRDASARSKSELGNKRISGGEKKRRGSGGRPRNITSASPKRESVRKRRIREREMRRRPS